MQAYSQIVNPVIEFKRRAAALVQKNLVSHGRLGMNFKLSTLHGMDSRRRPAAIVVDFGQAAALGDARMDEGMGGNRGGSQPSAFPLMQPSGKRKFTGLGNSPGGAAEKLPRSQPPGSDSEDSQ